MSPVTRLGGLAPPCIIIHITYIHLHLVCRRRLSQSTPLGAPHDPSSVLPQQVNPWRLWTQLSTSHWQAGPYIRGQCCLGISCMVEETAKRGEVTSRIKTIPPVFGKYVENITPLQSIASPLHGPGVWRQSWQNPPLQFYVQHSLCKEFSPSL